MKVQQVQIVSFNFFLTLVAAKIVCLASTAFIKAQSGISTGRQFLCKLLVVTGIPLLHLLFLGTYLFTIQVYGLQTIRAVLEHQSIDFHELKLTSSDA